MTNEEFEALRPGELVWYTYGQDCIAVKLEDGTFKRLVQRATRRVQIGGRWQYVPWWKEIQNGEPFRIRRVFRAIHFDDFYQQQVDWLEKLNEVIETARRRYPNG